MIGQRSKDGLLEIVDVSQPDENTINVTVRELIGNRCWVGGVPVARMRRFARRGRPKGTRTHIVRQFYNGSCDHVTFALTEK